VHAQDRAAIEQHAAGVRGILQKSQAYLQANGYEWMETTVVGVGGDEKSRKQERCYYGADGKIQKIPVSQSAEQGGGPPGVLPLGRIMKKAAAHKKEEMTEYMQRAAGLAHGYVPVDSERIRRVIEGGKGTVQILEPGRRVRLELRDYIYVGDTVAIDLDIAANRLLGLQVASYLDTPQDAVTLNVQMGILPEGPSFASHIVLNAKAKDLTVTIDNSGYRRQLR
jgi:hypothetical protein